MLVILAMCSSFTHMSKGLYVSCFLILCGWIISLNGAASKADPTGDQWLIQVAEAEDAEAVAEAVGAVYVGPLENVDGWHRVAFIQPLSKSRVEHRESVFRTLQARPELRQFEEVKEVRMYPRRFVPQDPLFTQQWHHENLGRGEAFAGSDIRVRPAWDRGLSGRGVVIGIVDQGTDFRHPDLSPNYLPGSGRDYNDNDDDASPSGEDDRHGTAVAGIAVAASNTLGGLGVAYQAQFVPLRLIAGPYKTGQDAEALSYRKEEVAIYNNSWGPSDTAGVRYAAMSSSMRSALASNVSTGRGGLGNIYVWAAGNGGLNNDNSNYDGYNASPYTISVGALGDDNIKAGYSEPGANLLVVAPSLGRGAGIVTTDNQGSAGYTTTDYYNSFSGTSAAAPMVSGVAALMLEANPLLNWREVQLILARTAVPVDFAGGDWVRNAAGRWVSHDYGFGRVDAASATELATQWQSVGPRTGTGIRTNLVSQSLPPWTTRTNAITIAQDFSVEHVLVTLSLNADDWSTFIVDLESPSGTISTLAEPYQTPNTNWPSSWTYLSMRHLDESSLGEWTLHVTNTRTGTTATTPVWGSWRLEVLGSQFPAQPNTAPQAEDLVIDSSAFPIEIDALAGVHDPDGDPVHILSVQRPGFGQLDDLGNGRFSFTMGVTKDGTDRFGVLLSDGKGGVHWRMVQVRDPRPIGRPDSFVLRANVTEMLDVLANDLDPDGNSLIITEVSAPAYGTVVIVNNQLEYTPAPGFVGVDRFRYGLSDGVDGDSQAWVTVVVQEIPDVAIELDGVDDYVVLPPATGRFLRDQFTAEAWFYARDWGEYATGFGRIFDNDTFLIFLNGVDHAFYNDGSIVVFMRVKGQGAIALNSAAHAVRLHQWHHVALSFDSSDTIQPVRLYIDGQRAGATYPLENTSPPRDEIINDEVFPMYIGESANGTRAFNGKLTEIRVWNRVRSAAEIFAGHDLRMSGGEWGLQIYLPFDDIDWLHTANRGAFPFDATIFEAQRVPRIAPWSGLEQSFDLLGVSTDGWWEDSILGSVFGDRYPWIYLPEAGWAYAAGRSTDGYFLWLGQAGFGWAWVDRDLFPWIYLPESDRWLWRFAATSGD